jgi:HEAT repeat protein
MGLFGKKKSKGPDIEKPDIEKMVQERDVEGVLGALGLEDSNVRFLALDALARMNVKDLRAVEPLIAALEDESPIVRLAAVAVLSDYIGDPRVVEALTIAAAVEKDPEIRSHMESLLRKAGEKAGSAPA